VAAVEKRHTDKMGNNQTNSKKLNSAPKGTVISQGRHEYYARSAPILNLEEIEQAFLNGLVHPDCSKLRRKPGTLSTVTHAPAFRCSINDAAICTPL